MTRVPKPADHIRPAAGPATAPAAAGQAAAARQEAAAGQAAGAGPISADPAASGRAGVGSVESLYPFLYSGATDLSVVMTQARTSSVAKTREIMELREQVCTASSGMLVSCARDAAARFTAGGRLLTFGNGGSATDAQQLATLFCYPGPGATPLPAISLASDTAVMSALSNDVGVDVVFARQIAALGRPIDIAVGLSTSGNSENLLRAFDEASRLGLMTVGIAGYDGGKMAELDSIDYLFVVPSLSVHRIQEAQTTIYHIWWELTTAACGGPPVAS